MNRPRTGLEAAVIPTETLVASDRKGDVMKRFTGFAATILAAVVATTLVQAPAQAVPRLEKYYVISQVGDKLQKWFWIDQIDGIIGCERCFWEIDLGTSVSLPAAVDKAFHEQLTAGLAKMSDAHIQRDPAAAAKLQQEAMSAFSSAARSLGSASVRPGVVGYYDELKQTTVPAHRAWLAAADQDLSDGLTLLQRSFAEPDPHPWRAAALREFTKAYAEIAAKRAL